MLELNNYLAAGALWDVVYKQEPNHLPQLSALATLKELLDDGRYEEFLEADRINRTDSHDYVLSQLHSRLNTVLHQNKRNPNISHERALRLAGLDGQNGAPGFAIYKVRSPQGRFGHLRFACSTHRFNLRLKIYQERPVAGQPARPLYTIDSEVSSFGRQFNTVSYDEIDVQAWAPLLIEMLDAVQPFIVRPVLEEFVINAMDHLDDIIEFNKDEPRHVQPEAI